MDEPVSRQRIACKAVIAHDSKVLLVRESVGDGSSQAGKFGIPGGQVEVGEAFLDGLKREVFEETGLTDIRVIKPFFVGEWRPLIRGQKTQIVAIFFACETDSTEVRLSEEHDDFRWVSADDWQQLDLMAPDDEVLTAYFAEL